MSVEPLHALADELERHAHRLAREADNHPAPAAHLNMIAEHLQAAAKLRATDTSAPHPLLVLERLGVIGPVKAKPKPKRKAKPAEPDARHRRYMTEFVNRELRKLDARNHAAKRAAAEHSTLHLGG